MSEVIRLRTRAEVDEEAAAWIWRMDAAAPTAEDRRQFEAWLRQDPRHQRAVDELKRVWGELDRLARSTRSDSTLAISEQVTLPTHRGRHAWWLTVAAVMALAIAGAGWLQRGSEFQTLQTAVGQQRNVILADGSIVTLNTNTVVTTDLRHRERQIYLRKGEAHFQVAHDRSRPFLVHAGDAVVRAVGTAFEVRLREDQHVDVLVNEGRVEVQATGDAPMGGPASGGQPARGVSVRAVSAGEQLSTATSDILVMTVSPVKLSTQMAWREGAIVFDGEPLAAAVADIERYTDARIVVSDTQIGELRVGGRFRTGDVQGFLDGLQAALPVVVRRGANGLVYIDPRP